MVDPLILADGNVVSISSEIKAEPVKESFMPKRPRDVFAHIGAERIVNTWGSASGAGSDFFDIYRKHRAKEMDRVEHLEKEFQEGVENKIFQAKREERIVKMLAKTAKKRDRRKRKKMKKMGLIGAEKQSSDDEQSDDNDYQKTDGSPGNDNLLQQAQPVQVKKSSSITIEVEPDF